MTTMRRMRPKPPVGAYCFRVDPKGDATSVERRGTWSFWMVQAEAWDRVKGFGLFASPTRNTLQGMGADICSVTDIFAFSLRARKMVLKCMPRIMPKPVLPRSYETTKPVAFDAQAFLDSTGVARKVVDFRKKATIFAQGDTAKHVMYIQQGGVRLSVVNSTGKEAVVAVLKPGDFFGEGCLAGQPIRMGSATSTAPTTVLVIDKDEMIRVLHAEHEFSDRFITHMLSRNIRVEEDLIDQLFNSTEKRLARALLLLARYGKDDEPQRILPKVSQETLAEMIGTTRSRVNLFMNKFKKMGFIDNKDGLQINSSLLSVVLHD
jgi:CRP/FNR family cyclic AMP-dependent transcriptional regulator